MSRVGLYGSLFFAPPQGPSSNRAIKCTPKPHPRMHFSSSSYRPVAPRCGGSPAARALLVRAKWAAVSAPLAGKEKKKRPPATPGYIAEGVCRNNRRLGQGPPPATVAGAGRAPNGVVERTPAVWF